MYAYSYVCNLFEKKSNILQNMYSLCNAMRLTTKVSQRDKLSHFLFHKLNVEQNYYEFVF